MSMAGIRKHDWTAIFAALRADGWTLEAEGKTSLRKHAEAAGISPGTLLPKIRQERAKGAAGMLATPSADPPAPPSKRKGRKIVDPDADLPA